MNALIVGVAALLAGGVAAFVAGFCLSLSHSQRGAPYITVGDLLKAFLHACRMGLS